MAVKVAMAGRGAQVSILQTLTVEQNLLASMHLKIELAQETKMRSRKMVIDRFDDYPPMQSFSASSAATSVKSDRRSTLLSFFA